MRVEWHGQSAFTLTGEERDGLHRPVRRHVAAAPSAGCSSSTRRSRPTASTCCSSPTSTATTTAVEVDRRRAAVAALDRRARTSRRSARWSAIASEHDDAAGTERGPNTIFVFELDGAARRPLRRLRPGRAAPRAGAAIGDVDLLFLPVGGGPTIGGAQAAEIAERARRRAGSCRCTTGPRGSASSRPRRSSSRRCRRSQRLRCARLRHRGAARGRAARPRSSPPLPEPGSDARRRRGRWRGRRARGRRRAAPARGAVP